jgi:hypothetical protein
MATSIYDRPITVPRNRRRASLGVDRPRWPDQLRRSRHPTLELQLALQRLRAEVAQREAVARRRPVHDRRSSAALRTCLLHLRAFGRLLAQDLDCVPDDHRPRLLELLQLEHRWCYAAAGTTREDFEVAKGRTGAR